MYRNIHPTTSDVLTFVLHMNNGIIQASLKPHISDIDADGDGSEQAEEARRMWNTTHGVVLVPAMPPLDRRPSGESTGSSSTPEEPDSLLGDTSHLLISPKLAACLSTLPLNVSDDATGNIYLEPEAAAYSARIFARSHKFEENSPRGWKLVRRNSIFTAPSIRSGIELRIDALESAVNSTVWNDHTSVRFDMTDMGVTESGSVLARRAPVFAPESHRDLMNPELSTGSASWGIGRPNQSSDWNK
ncbi:hypothetical protein F5X68DRAFT_259346 [Plectosphaerella plurivora]|uniref:Uncharacterized protein n=1 Tax=Plectosphaerella plurivora TaxID=936078 RepID=A0A9P9AF33_9PEZI|nr:hypothetical protein F5X68DRAFT_259346 [Plectosphaerella plurivora]